MDAATLGKYLHDTRQLQEKTLEDAERTLRIRRTILEAFERGEFSIVGADAQTRGLLRNYANYLKLDAERILELYESSKLEASKRSRRRKAQTQPLPAVNASLSLSAPRKITDTQPNLPLGRRSESRRERLLSALANLGMASLALGAVAVILVVTFSLLEDAPPPTPDSLALAERPSTLVPSPTMTLRPLLSPTPLTTPNPFRGQGIAVLLDITSRAWVRVTVDGQERQAGLLRPGERLPFEGVSQIVLDTSNGGGTQVTLNGVPQGPLGQRGQRVTIAYYPDRLELLSAPQDEPTPIMSDTPAPTPTSPAATLALEITATFEAVPPTEAPSSVGPSPTPAPSLTPSVTPPPTVTLTPSFTPSATPTITSTASNTPTPSLTPTPSITPSPTLTPSITPTPRPTAVLPPRTTPSNLPTPKGG